MFVIAERSPGLRKHRDILEDIIGHSINSAVGSGFDHRGNLNHLQELHQCSQLDTIAVQSLLNLSAQQEPHDVPTVNSDQPIDPQAQARQIPAQQSAQDIGSAPFLPTRQTTPERVRCRSRRLRHPSKGHDRKRARYKSPAPGIDTGDQEPDFNFHTSWDVDGYSLEMLDSMTGIDLGF